EIISLVVVSQPPDLHVMIGRICSMMVVDDRRFNFRFLPCRGGGGAQVTRSFHSLIPPLDGVSHCCFTRYCFLLCFRCRRLIPASFNALASYAIASSRSAAAAAASPLQVFSSLKVNTDRVKV